MGLSNNTHINGTRMRPNIMEHTEDVSLYAMLYISEGDQRALQQTTSVRWISLSLTLLCKDTFWVAVLSSARQVAKFLAHWPSCMAAAWSATVGTADFADATILLPGWELLIEKQQHIHTVAVFVHVSEENLIAVSPVRVKALTCKKLWLAMMRASWAPSSSGWAWLLLMPCTSWGMLSATACV